MNVETTSSDRGSDNAACSARHHRVISGVVWLATTTVVYLISLWLLKHHPGWSAAARIAVTLAPLLPGIFYLRALLKSFWQMDELQRRIQTEALGFAFVGTVIVLTAVNVCAAEGVRLVAYPTGLGIGGVYLTVFFLWSVGVSISTFRYR